MRVLLVEDDTSVAKSIELMLQAEGFIVDTTDLGEDGLEIGKIYDYDIIILDLMLPDIDGYEVLRRLRAARVSTPILILSGLSELDNKIKGLGFGADDYLTKPFDRRELVARIHAIIRRSKGHSDSVIRTGKLVVNLDTRTVEVDSSPLHLTGKEYGILELLWRHGRTRTEDHRRVRLQAAQETDAGCRRRKLYRNRLGPRLCLARSSGGRRQQACSRENRLSFRTVSSSRKWSAGPWPRG